MKIREKLKGDENWGVESQTMFANNNFHYRFDLIIKYKDDVQAIFELKTGIKSIKSEIKRAIIKQCGLYRELFPQSSPFVFVTDGNDFHEVSEDKPYDWGEGEDIDKVIERILGRKNDSEIPKYKSFIKKLKESTKKEVQEFAREIEEGNTESYFDMNLNTFSFTPEYERKFLVFWSSFGRSS